MTSNLPSGICRFLASACFTMIVVAPPAKAQNAALTGVYNGAYRCAQGQTNLKLSLMVTAGGELSGLFTFYLPPGTQNQGYTYSLHGQYDPRTAKFSLMPTRWETQHPANFTMVGLNGSFDSNELAGSITGAGCSTFNVERNGAESANITAVMALQRSAAPADAGAAPSAPPRPPVTTPPPVAQQRPAPPAPVRTPQTATIKHVCYSTDASAPAYFSEIFDLPDEGSTSDNFLNYEQAKLSFYIYLINTHRYAGTRESVTCVYLNSTTTPNVAAAIAARRQSLQGQAAAVGKQVVDTHWTYTKTPASPATSTATAAPRASQPAKTAAATPPAGQARGGSTPLSPDAQKAADDVAKSAQAAGQASRNVDKSFAKVTGPILSWGMKSEKDALTDEVTTKITAMRFIPGATDGVLQGYVTANAYCSSNGVSVVFTVGAGEKDPDPSFPWYTDTSRGDDQVADVRIRVDGRPVHVAQGFPNIEGRQLYTNTLGLLFYEPGTFERAVRDQQDSLSTGVPALDGLLGGMVRQSAQANAQAWQDSAAGPLGDLLDARSIRIELPVTTFNPKPILDLNPQDAVLHKFVSDCNARFAGNGGRAR